MFQIRSSWTALACLCAAACGKSEAPAAPSAEKPASQAVEQAPPAPATANVDDPKEVFKTRCVMCHGENGKGDGPASAALNPKPRNYTDPEWQKSVTDEQIKKTIIGGGASVGKSPIMPAQPDLAAKPELLDGIVKIVRAFGTKG